MRYPVQNFQPAATLWNFVGAQSTIGTILSLRTARRPVGYAEKFYKVSVRPKCKKFSTIRLVSSFLRKFISFHSFVFFFLGVFRSLCHFSPPCLRLFTFSSSLVPFLVSLVSFSTYSTVLYITFLQYNFQFCFGGQFASVSRLLHSPLTQPQFSLAVTM